MNKQAQTKTSNIKCKDYTIYINDGNALKLEVEKSNPSKVFVLVDDNTQEHCLHYMYEKLDEGLQVISIEHGELNKNITTSDKIWDQLLNAGADRNSILINLGGGVIGDMGGFCASTYMRGIKFIQMPTTLLSQVDASVGGKLGVDHRSIKNMVGMFQNPQAVIINTDFLQTLPYKELLSGYAELLKHGLIADKLIWEQLSTVDDITLLNFGEIVKDSVIIKKNVTEEDPTEQGLRKILNFGHTIGHAIETLSFQNDPLLHGEAIAIGMITEAHLSWSKGYIKKEEYQIIKSRIKSLFGNKYKSLPTAAAAFELMKFDKKNKGGKILFSLLESVGKANFNQEVTMEQIEAAFQDYID